MCLNTTYVSVPSWHPNKPAPQAQPKHPCQCSQRPRTERWWASAGMTRLFARQVPEVPPLAGSIWPSLRLVTMQKPRQSSQAGNCLLAELGTVCMHDCDSLRRLRHQEARSQGKLPCACQICAQLSPALIAPLCRFSLAPDLNSGIRIHTSPLTTYKDPGLHTQGQRATPVA